MISENRDGQRFVMHLIEVVRTNQIFFFTENAQCNFFYYANDYSAKINFIYGGGGVVFSPGNQ